MKIKAVVFDYGQVISLPHDPKVIDRLAERAGAERDKFEALMWSLRGEFDRGTINAKEYYKQLLSRLEVSLDEKSVDELIEMDLTSWRNINAGTVALMEDVKKAGYLLGILSNMPHEFLAWARKSIPVFALTDKSLFSCELNLIKPEKAIYEKLLAEFGVRGEELVFFDDITENISSARTLGIQALLWKNPENARSELLSLGVKL